MSRNNDKQKCLLTILQQNYEYIPSSIILLFLTNNLWQQLWWLFVACGVQYFYFMSSHTFILNLPISNCTVVLPLTNTYPYNFIPYIILHFANNHYSSTMQVLSSYSASGKVLTSTFMGSIAHQWPTVYTLTPTLRIYGLVMLLPKPLLHQQQQPYSILGHRQHQLCLDAFITFTRLV